MFSKAAVRCIVIADNMRGASLERLAIRYGYSIVSLLGMKK